MMENELISVYRNVPPFNGSFDDYNDLPAFKACMNKMRNLGFDLLHAEPGYGWDAKHFIASMAEHARTGRIREARITASNLTMILKMRADKRDREERRKMTHGR